MSNDIDQRLRHALGDAAGQLAPDGTRPPGLDLPTRSRTPRWPVIAVAAAAAVSLIVAVPYAVHKPDNEPTIAKAPVTEAPPDPAPLGPPLTPTVNPFFLGNGHAIHSIDGDLVQKLGGGYWTASAGADRRTFYLGWHANNASCSARIEKITIASNGKQAKRDVVRGTEQNGVVLGNVAISPDGKRLAWTYDTAHRGKSGCLPAMSTPNPGDKHGLSVLDLTTGQRRDWSIEQTLEMIDQTSVGWSMDSRFVVFPWPINLAPTTAEAADVAPPQMRPTAAARPAKVIQPKEHRMLDPTIAAGDLVALSRKIPLDATPIADYSLFEILRAGDFYPAELTAYGPQGGARVLATARLRLSVKGKPRMVLLDVWLGSGKITVIDEDYNPMQGKPGW
jgi:hypothetical protein